MRFKTWVEGFDSSVRRKLQGAVQQYLGKPFNVGKFSVDPTFTHGSVITGQSDGIRQDNGDIIVKQVGSGLHELLHQAGFMPIGIGEFLNEGITQVVAEDIGRQFKLPVALSYKDRTDYVRRYLIPNLAESVHEFAKAYAKSQNKGKLVVDMIWAKNGPKFSNRTDWGSNPYGAMLKHLPFIVGPYDPHLNFLTDG